MSNYIKRDAAINAWKEWAVNLNALCTLEDVPSVDAVEVVRCKDCVYHDPNWDACTRWTCDPFHQASVRDNDYCSCGIRKIEEEDK